MQYYQINCIQDLQPFDKLDQMYVMLYKNKPKQFPKTKSTIVLKNAELYIFDKLSSPPKFQFPLDHCQAAAVSENFIKLSNDIQNAGPLFKIRIKDGAEFLMLPENYEKQYEWVQTFISYSENYKIYLKHKITTQQMTNQLSVRVMVTGKMNQITKEIIYQTLMHIARVTNVTIDEEGVCDIYGQFVSPIAVLDALDNAGFKTQLLSLVPFQVNQ